MLYGDDPVKFGGIYVPMVAAMLQSGNLYVYCMNNPLLYEDDGGEFIHLVIGAAVGAVVSAGISVATQAIAGEKISWSRVGLAAAGGAFSGGLAASGFGPVGQVVGNGLIAGVTDIGDQAIKNGGFHDISASSVVKSTIIGATAGLVGGNGMSKSVKLRTLNEKLIKKLSSHSFNLIAKGVKYYFSQTKTLYWNYLIRPIVRAGVTTFSGIALKEAHEVKK